ncbi:MAG: hypothetical protein RL518_2724 [Pseudomonadota bacterium]
MLARRLLGCRLVTMVRGVRASGLIVEVEAYLGVGDPACHAARGMTRRNAVMFKDAGHCYVYFIYGMYHCVNVVSDPEGIGSGILIRAVEPSEGIAVMRRRRRGADIGNLARGPGKVCQSFAISSSFSGEHFATSRRIWIEPFLEYATSEVGVSGRVGISAGADMPLRLFVRGSPWVSGRRS